MDARARASKIYCMADQVKCRLPTRQMKDKYEKNGAQKG